MKIRITTAVAGAAFNYAAGDVIELPDADAAKFLAAGFATPIKTTKGKTEKAVTPELVPIETTTDPDA